MAYEPLTEEQREIRDLVRQLARERIAPRAAEIDESHEFPWDVVELFRDNDLFGLFFDEEYGGLGTGTLLGLVAMEEVSKVCATSGLILAVQELGSLGLKLAGDEEQKQRYLPRLASGEWLCAYALTESGSGSDSVAMRTTAVRDGDTYVINGSKRFITNAGVAQLYTVFAKTDPEAGHAGISALVGAARGLLYKYGAAVDEGIEGPELTKLSAMTKLYCTDVAMEVTTDAVQVLGGYGYIQEYPLERMMRDAKITQIYEGTNQIQRLVIAREMLKEQRAFLLASVG